MYILPFTFSDHGFILVQFQALLFVQLRRHYLLYIPLFRGTQVYSATRKQESSLKVVQYLLTLASRITSLGLLRSVLLLTESLQLVGDDSTTFQGV